MDSMKLTAALAVVNSFKDECECFGERMDRSMRKLSDAIAAARGGWKDDGYRAVSAKVRNVQAGVMEIKKTITEKVIPFVRDLEIYLQSRPYS